MIAYITRRFIVGLIMSLWVSCVDCLIEFRNYLWCIMFLQDTLSYVDIKRVVSLLAQSNVRQYNMVLILISFYIFWESFLFSDVLLVLCVHVSLIAVIGVASIFPAWCTHLLPKILTISFLVITLLHVLYAYFTKQLYCPPTPKFLTFSPLQKLMLPLGMHSAPSQENCIEHFLSPVGCTRWPCLWLLLSDLIKNDSCSPLVQSTCS